jgi:threonine dehydrogenase-like Zn-dependent dehydrogenase
MKALVAPEANRLEIQEIPEPRIGPYDARVRIDVCGICNSTDAKLVEGTMFWAPPFPIVLGHESAGTVVEVGGRVKKFKVGDVVTRPMAWWPGEVEGPNIAIGGFAEFGIVRDGLAMAEDGDPSLLDDGFVLHQVVVPEGIGSHDAALAISLAETASVLKHLPNMRGKTVVVAGTGIAGLAFTLWCKMAGAAVVTLGRRKQRLELARARGADGTIDTSSPGWTEELRDKAGGSVDGLVEASGDADLAEKLLGVLGPEGFASAYGVPPTGIEYSSRWVPSPTEEHLGMPWVCDLLLRGWVKPEWFVTHEWDFGKAVSAFDQVKRGEVVKGFLKIG